MRRLDEGFHNFPSTLTETRRGQPETVDNRVEHLLSDEDLSPLARAQEVPAAVAGHLQNPGSHPLRGLVVAEPSPYLQQGLLQDVGD